MNELICNASGECELTAVLDELCPPESRFDTARLEKYWEGENWEAGYEIRQKGYIGSIRTDYNGFIKNIKLSDKCGAKAHETVQKYIGYLLVY